MGYYIERKVIASTQLSIQETMEVLECGHPSWKQGEIGDTVHCEVCQNLISDMGFLETTIMESAKPILAALAADPFTE